MTKEVKDKKIRCIDIVAIVFVPLFLFNYAEKSASRFGYKRKMISPPETLECQTNNEKQKFVSRGIRIFGYPINFPMKMDGKERAFVYSVSDEGECTFTLYKGNGDIFEKCKKIDSLSLIDFIDKTVDCTPIK